MTTFPDLPDADKIAAMRARAKTEAEQYGQTTVPAMLLQGAAWGEEVVRLRKALTPFAFFSDDDPSQTAQEAWEIRYRDRFHDWIDFGDIEAARAALEGPK